jgi:phage terminase small subunit
MRNVLLIPCNPYSNKTAKKKGAELLKTNREVLAFDNKTGASLSTCLI